MSYISFLRLTSFLTCAPETLNPEMSEDEYAFDPSPEVGIDPGRLKVHPVILKECIGKFQVHSAE